MEVRIETMNKIINILKNQLYAISLYARQIAGTLVLFIIARYLTVYDFGLFSSYRNIAVFCFMFANLGFNDYILVSSKANVKEVKLKIALFLLNAILIAFLCCIFSNIFKLDSHLLFILVVIRTFFDGIFFQLILPYFQASKKFNTIAIINIAYAIFITIIAVLSYILKLSLTKFLMFNITLGLINFIQCSYFARINYITVLAHIKKIMKMLDPSIFAYIGVTIAYFLYAQIPSLYVSTQINKEDAALYFSAFTIAAVIGLLVAAQTQKMMPEMINADKNRIKQVINDNLKIVLTITISVLIFMIIFGKLLLYILYGQKYYSNAYIILLILTIANICVAEAAVYGTYITASGNQKRKIPMQLEATAITIMSLFILHKFGIYGATVSFLLAAIYTAFRYTIFTLKLLKKENIKETTCNN